MINVSVGLVYRGQKILLARRHMHQHQGGLWEFPGGKIEPKETPFEALQRELREEVDISVSHAHATMCIQHHYADKSVRLHIFDVLDFSGEVAHQEEQEIRWVGLSGLTKLSIPAANQPILGYLNGSNVSRTQRHE